MIRKLLIVLSSVMICLLGITPVLVAQDRWGTLGEYEKSTGKKIEKFSEAPELRVLVAKGELPPVEERLPKDPLVVRGFDGIGKYGGILNTIALSPSPVEFNRTVNLLSGTSGFTTDQYPNTAKSVEMVGEGREWIIRLREGMKWSDGAPFTADDIIFWYEDIVLNKELSPTIIAQLKVGDEIIKMEKVDDYTVKVSASIPFHFDQFFKVHWDAAVYPKHYLQQFHAKYVDKDKLDEMVKDEGFDSWIQLFLDRADYDQTHNPGYPVLVPWVLLQAPPATPTIYGRNPYYWVVDEEGNQLPYIGTMHRRIVGSEEVVSLQYLAGDVDFGHTVLSPAYPLLKDAERAGRIKVSQWSVGELISSLLVFNITHKDPSLRKIFADKRFRFASSYALDRKMINELVYLGVNEPSQSAPTKNSRFYYEKLSRTAIEFDKAKANSLLDEMGLEKRDADGYRLRPDGKKLTITLIGFTMWGSFPEAEMVGEIITDNLEAVGLEINFRMLDWNLFWERVQANEYDGIIQGPWGTLEGMYLSDQVSDWLATSNVSLWAPLWSKWYRSGGELGEEPSAVMLQAIEDYTTAKNSFDPEEQEVYFRKVLDTAADNLWTIATVTFFGKVMITNPKMKNFPTSFKAWWRGDWGRAETWFFQES